MARKAPKTKKFFNPDLQASLDRLSEPELVRLAKASATTPVYLYHLKEGFRRASPDLAQRLVANSHGRLQLRVVRPDIWGDGKAA